jgi:glycosyltransferase A (GT-A) superfamily protein (DUF2064 family)
LKQALIVFLKDPRPGTVKTRLCPPYSPDQAAALYKAMAEDVIRAHAARRTYDMLLLYAPPGAGGAIKDWIAGAPGLIEGERTLSGRGGRPSGGEHRFISQTGADLGERQYNAFRAAFDLGYERAVIIGTDCLGISAEDVERAFNLLEERDLVLGPSEDGGYYLIGCSRAPEFLLGDIAWSTSHVLGQLLEQAEQAGVECGLLARKFDVDTCEDVLRLHSDLAEGKSGAKAPATLEVLKGMIGGDT